MSNDVTLAICAYNAERYIAETLRSVIAQSFQAFDLLIINDCSTDGTIATVKHTLDGSGREYNLVNFELNMGIANARQVALERALTKYIIFVDADDLPHKTLLEEEHEVITSDPDIIAVSCRSEFINANSKRVKGGLMLGPTTKKEFMNKAASAKLIFLPIQTMFDREAAISVGGFALDGFPKGDLRYCDFCEDLDLWCRMSDLYVKGKYIISIPKVLYSYRKIGSGLSANSANMILKMKYIKHNLKLRRASRLEVSFVDFMKTISPEELKQIKLDSFNSSRLRNGVISIQKGNILSGGYMVIRSIIANPKYFWQKVKANSGLFK